MHSTLHANCTRLTSSSLSLAHRQSSSLHPIADSSEAGTSLLPDSVQHIIRSTTHDKVQPTSEMTQPTTPLVDHASSTSSDSPSPTAPVASHDPSASVSMSSAFALEADSTAIPTHQLDIQTDTLDEKQQQPDQMEHGQLVPNEATPLTSQPEPASEIQQQSRYLPMDSTAPKETTSAASIPIKPALDDASSFSSPFALPSISSSLSLCDGSSAKTSF